MMASAESSRKYSDCSEQLASGKCKAAKGVWLTVNGASTLKFESRPNKYCQLQVGITMMASKKLPRAMWLQHLQPKRLE